MRIVVNDIAASSGGAMTVLQDFYRAVRDNDTENEWIFLLGDNYVEPTENIKVITLPQIKNSRAKKILFDCFTGKKFIEKLNPDVVFSMQNIITFGLKIPQIVYIHQPVPFQTAKKFSFLKGSERSLAIYQYLIAPLIRKSAKKAAKVIVQTEWMKDAVIKQCKLPAEKIVKISPNVKNLVDFVKHGEFDKKEFFYPTSKVIYKNNNCVFSACDLLDKEDIDYHVTLTLPKEFSTDKITCTGRIAYEEVINNYNQSTLIFPSYIETFGYPLIEARTMGAIVLASDCPFSRELLAGYENGYFFDPFKPEELASLMKKVISGEIIRKESKSEYTCNHDNWLDVMNTVKQRRVLFLTNVPSPYRVDFFNELGKLCDLTVLFEKASSDERDDSWKNFKFKNFNGVILKGKSTDVDKSFAPSVMKYLSEKLYDRIIVANMSTPTGMFAIQYMKMNRIPYYIEGDGAFPKSGKSVREILKKYLMHGAKGYFSTSEMHDKYYLAYGAEAEIIHRYPFTSLSTGDIDVSFPTSDEKSALRKKLGMSEDKIVLTVGQMIHRKGFDVLLKAAASLSKEVGIYIIGGKPTKEYECFVNEHNLNNVHFVDFMLKPELSEYYRAADLFVLPTREDIWGLVINEAMAHGLPIITTNRCIAGLELVENGKNGYIVNVEDVDMLAERINEIMSNDALRLQMAEQSIDKISNYTVDKMAERHMEILFF